MSANHEPIDGLDVSAYEARCLATETLVALGVNMRADDGKPTLKTIYQHSLHSLGSDLQDLANSLEAEHEEIAHRVSRLNGRLALIRDYAESLQRLHASSKKRGGAP